MEANGRLSKNAIAKVVSLGLQMHQVMIQIHIAEVEAQAMLSTLNHQQREGTMHILTLQLGFTHRPRDTSPNTVTS
jgi:hypothetical protein